ncbi:DUF2283 domain-containing protein [Thermofilum sp.]|jgi:uncharacterized protein YuzE|uniref:DUF2283 domain-containing protein n=1 Tax=Thermofilum sp. TaxID=1961369 RepID=UPI00258AE544|nr:DUF2283 domain-containing protein [Thermofilum sp.]
MRVRYDKGHDVLYIDVAPGKKARETQPLNDDIFVDIDEEGNIVGIEIWNASKNIVDALAEPLIEKVKKSIEKSVTAGKNS